MNKQSKLRSISRGSTPGRGIFSRTTSRFYPSCDCKRNHYLPTFSIEYMSSKTSGQSQYRNILRPALGLVFPKKSREQSGYSQWCCFQPLLGHLSRGTKLARPYSGVGACGIAGKHFINRKSQSWPFLLKKHVRFVDSLLPFSTSFLSSRTTYPTLQDAFTILVFSNTVSHDRETD